MTSLAPVGWSMPDWVGSGVGLLPWVDGGAVAAPAELQAAATRARVTAARGSLIFGMPPRTPVAGERFPAFPRVRTGTVGPRHGPVALGILRISREIRDRTANR